jgi:Domain of unknown function (DUF5047)
MTPRSARFDTAIAADHVVSTRVEVLQDGEPVADLSALGVVHDGAVQVENADVRRSGQLSLVDFTGELQPTGTASLLAPTGAELRLWRGIAYPDGAAPELLPVGTLRFVVTTVSDRRIDLELHDRAWAIGGAELEHDLQVLAGTNLIAAIQRLLTAAGGAGLPVNFPASDETTPMMIFEAGTDPWAAARELAANAGMVLWFDPLGVCQMTPEPDPQVDRAVWSFDDRDGANLALPGLAAVWDGTGPNKVIVIGENSDASVTWRGVWTDDDPASPTRYGGPYGRRPLTIRDEKIASQPQASARAKAEGLRRAGLAQTVTIPALVHPAFEAGDVLACHDTRSAVSQLAVLERFSVPLRAAGTMTLEARGRQVTST